MTTTPCLRCQWPCVVRPDDPMHLPAIPVDAVRAAKGPHGLCLECALHWWLLTIDGFRWALQENDPMFLVLPQVQELLKTTFERIDTHIDITCINWRTLITQWALPWPKGWDIPKDTPHAPTTP